MKTLEEVIEHACRDMAIGVETYPRFVPTQIARAVREWMLSKENVELAGRVFAEFADDMGEPIKNEHVARSYGSATLEAVIGRTDTHCYTCTPSQSVGVGHGRSGDGDPANHGETND